MKVIGIVGWKNSGKTTLIENLVATFVDRGLRVSTVKHAHHDFDIDQRGKDSDRHRAAGAFEVIIASGTRWALLHELRHEPEPAIDDLLARLAPVDLVIVEGFKRHTHPKIEVIRDESKTPIFASGSPGIVAVAAKNPQLAAPLPVLSLDAPGVVGDFILAHLGMNRGL